MQNNFRSTPEGEGYVRKRNDMECREDWRTDPKQMGYIELIVAPGATLVYPENLSGQSYEVDIYKGARFVVNGILNGKPEAANCDIGIFNEGTLEVNGVIDGSYKARTDHGLMELQADKK